MRKIVIWSVILVVIAGLIYGYFTGMFNRGNKGDVNALQIVPVTRRDIGSTVIATGIIKPSVGSEVRVGCRVSGIVNKLHVSVGDHINKGQLLAELDPTELEARYNQATASLKNAQAELQYAKVDVERKRELSMESLISRNELDEAERAYDVAKSELEQSEANLDYARIQLEYTKINAPISGVVASVSTQEGETVAASFAAPTFVTIIDLNRLEVWAYVDETDIGRIDVGQQAFFTVDTYTDTDFEGKVTAIYPKAEIQDNVVNYVTILEIIESQGKILRPDMTTTVTIFLEKKENALVVPTNAVQREEGQKYVYVSQNDQIIKKQVKVGWKDKRYTEILEGLKEGEKAVIGDLDLLNELITNQILRRQNDSTP